MELAVSDPNIKSSAGAESEGQGRVSHADCWEQGGPGQEQTGELQQTLKFLSRRIFVKVSRQECENMAKQLKTPFIECSAKNRMNVDQAFYELVRLIRKFQALERPITQGQAGNTEKSKSSCSLL